MKFTVDDEFAPLHEGTKAVIRSNSLSGIANRYISLDARPDRRRPIGSGGTIPADGDTQSAVDLDQLFNTLDPQTRKGLQQLIRGSARTARRQGQPGQREPQATSPRRSPPPRGSPTSSPRDQVEFQKFVTDTSGVVSDDRLALERPHRAGGQRQRHHRARSATRTSRCPRRSPCCRARSRTAAKTFADLHTTLDTLDALVNESKPATKRLAPFLAELRPLIRDADPTIRDLRC